MILQSSTKVLSDGSNDLEYKIGGDDQYLISINLEETDDTKAFSQPDFGSIWLQDPTSSSSISLANGWLDAGQISGYGCLPLLKGSKIKGRLWHARDSYIGKLNVFIAAKNELPGQITPNWYVKTPGISIKKYGKLVGNVIDHTAEDLTMDIRPDDGFIWEIMELWFWHDDANARDLTPCYYDGITEFQRDYYSDVAQNYKMPFPADKAQNYSVIMSPITISHDLWIRIKANALAGGKALHCNYIVREYAE